jgi:hypothetical protein
MSRLRRLYPVVILTLIPACIYDPDEPCGDNQVLEAGECICAANALFDAGVCVLCDENEVVEGDECVCAEDFVRFAAGGPCEPKPAGDPCPQENDEFFEGECVCVEGFFRTETDGPCVVEPGDACTATDTTCATPWECFVFDSGSGDGYCTSFDCVTSDDCSGGFACNTDASPTVCERPPIGQGESCAEAAECAGFEADYCDSFMTGMCLVQNCTVDPNDCFEGWVCCDMSFVPVTLPNLCLPPANCPN